VGTDIFESADGAVKLKSPKLLSTLTSYYGPTGARFPVLSTDGAGPGTRVELVFDADIADVYDLDLYLMRGPAMGDYEVAGCITGAKRLKLEPAVFKGYAAEREFDILPIKGLRLEPGQTGLILQAAARDAAASGSELGLIGYRLAPANRRFLADWNLAGPFDAPDMDSLTTVYPPENGVDLAATYPGKGGAAARWKKIKAAASGYVDLTRLMQPNEQVVVYAAGWVRSPEDAPAHLLLGSDDGVRVWINDVLVHTNPAYRATQADQDRVAVRLKKGWNKVLLKILQGAGGFGFQARFADPDGKLVWSAEPPRE
jgi:hypothetical protein